MKNDEKDYSELRKKYSPFFDNLSWGFECGPGWYDIIENLTKDILYVVKDKELENCYAEQIKEKYGSLRFYMSIETNEISDLIKQAEVASEKICEMCGEPGSLEQKDYWLSVRCDKCKI